MTVSQKRGDDAQDHTPKAAKRPPEVNTDKQDGGNYGKQAEEVGSIPLENLNSADDEGGN